MLDKKMVPEIRFKGLKEEWKEFKLGNIGTFNSNGVDKVYREKDNVVHMVNYMDVYNKIAITSNNIDSFMITTANNSQLLKNNLIKGDILFTPSSETIDDIGHTFVVQETIPNFVYSYHLVRFRPNSEEFCENFANYCLDQKRLCAQYMLRAQGVQRFVLNREHFNSLSVIKPSLLEQKKINDLLSSFDSYINSQEQKLKKLQSMKQSLLDKMFIKNNQHMPSVRFNSYYDNWYYVNIQECSKVFIGLVTTMTTNYSKHGVLLIRNSDIKDGRFEFDENPIHLEQSFAMKNKSRMHMVGDVVTVHTGDVGTSAVVSEKEAKSIGFATIVTRPDKNKLDSSFLSVFLNTETHKKWAVQISTGDGRTNYNLGDYKLLNIPMTNLSEQQKIGQFFSNLDSLIRSQEQKLEKLNNIKQALLEKMFC
ncbi:restriction endonuclease subunit S [Mycoplasma sp. Z407A]|uniref:restriction endonuclease subunit S n=1 Tax=Mycoplasma sp. Z407A TaxID=3401678 RepID=UPI003AB02FE7